MPLPAGPEIAGLRDDLLARHAPVDTAEWHWVEQIAFAVWRQRRLRESEARLLAAVFAEGTNEPESGAAAASTRPRPRSPNRRERRRLGAAEGRAAAVAREGGVRRPAAGGSAAA